MSMTSRQVPLWRRSKFFKKQLLPPSDTDTASDTATDTATDAAPDTTPPTESNMLHSMYISAMELKKTIQQVRPSMPWPPTAATLNLQEAERTVPPLLLNFLAWAIGASEEPDTEKMVELSAPIQRRLLSISQDIIYLASGGRTLMPKNLSLGMAVRHMSGSAQLIGLLNGFGHCVSNSVVLNHDTALAEQELSRGESAIPSVIQPGIPTTVVWDNNDFGEETLSGRGTTHNTNGIIIQNCNTKPSSQEHCSSITVNPAVKRTRKRSMQPPEENLATYCGGKKDGPMPFAKDVSLSQSVYAPILQTPSKVDMAYYITKFRSDKLLPSWTGFNQLLSRIQVPPKSVVGYLPVIDASPTEMDTVLTILNRSVDIANKLQLETVVIVMDQAIYSKAQIIRWRNAHFMKRLVIRLGSFRTAMSFLGCLGKRFRDAGLQDILTESEVVGAGSVNGVFTGKHYNRAVRAYKLLAEAMHQMRLATYMNSIPEEEAALVRQLTATLSEAFPGQQYEAVLQGDSFQRFMTSYEKFIEAGNKKQTFAFWSSFIEMVEVLLLFLRGTREANWQLHLASIREMLPWMFAYDHVNYGRYLPAYWLEMLELPTTHPVVHQQCQEGDFAVQRSCNAFAKVACDQTIEQTANRDSKTKGGMTGFSTSKGAVNRWIWSHHARGSITRECEIMAGKGEQSGTRSDLLKSRMTRDKADVEKIVDTVNNMVNPFEYEEDELINIASGAVATKEVETDLENAKSRGESEFTTFCHKRLQKGDMDFFATLKKMKLKTFSSMSKAVKRKVRGKEVTLKADRNLLARLVVIGRFRNIDLQELLSYSLGALPLSISNSQGSLVKTNKANLLQHSNVRLRSLSLSPQLQVLCML